MRVKIDNYPSWIGPYQIANCLQHIGFSEERCDSIGEFLSETWLNSFCQKIYSWRQSKRVKVHIDKYDAWNADSTLAYIILPVLKELSKDKQGSPNVDDDDVPDNLKSTSCPPPKEKYNTDDNWHLRWDYVLGEMIWAFEQYNEDWESQYWIKEPVMGEGVKMENGATRITWEVEGEIDWEGRNAHSKRISNGFRLFGKYYENLWS